MTPRPRAPGVRVSRAASASQPAPRPRAPAPPAADPRAADAALHALWIALAVLAVARAGLTFVPSMWGWGLDAQRFLAPVPAWSLWALAALPLVPAFARALAAPATRLGDLLTAYPAASASVAAVIAAATVLALPDRVMFVGDALLRLGAARGQISADILFPQALPLDRYLHYGLPADLVAAGVDPQTYERALGALRAACLGALAVAFVRALALAGAAALAAVAAFVGCGALALCAGYGKALGELSLAVAALAVAGVRLARTGRGHWTLALVFAFALAQHRSAVLLAPAVARAWLEGSRRQGGERGLRAWLPLAAPALMLALMLPRMLRGSAMLDRAHLAPGGHGIAGALAAMSAPVHLADAANALLMLAPLALALFAMLPMMLPHLMRRPDGRVLVALAVGLLPVVLLVHPHQGIFRDWDVFVAPATALGVLAAWVIGESLRASPSRAGLAFAVALGVLAPCAQGMRVQSSLDGSLARIAAYLSEPPRRDDAERAQTWAFVGMRAFVTGRLETASTAYAHAIELAPSPRLLHEAAIVEAQRGRWREAGALFRRSAERSVTLASSWLDVARAARQAGDDEGMRDAARRALALAPADPEARAMLADSTAVVPSLR